MSRHIPEHPEKGSPEAYAWAAKMKKARLKAKIRKAGLKAEYKAFGPEGYFSKKNPGAKWHEGEENVAYRYKKQAHDMLEKAFFAGVEAAHKTSASAARKLHMNPKRAKKNPIAVYNPPTPKVVGTIYNKAIEIRAKKTGSDLAGKYKHVFGKNVKILGLDNGDVVIHHTGGKRLWISRKEYERTRRKHE